MTQKQKQEKTFWVTPAIKPMTVTSFGKASTPALPPLLSKLRQFWFLRRYRSIPFTVPVVSGQHQSGSFFIKKDRKYRNGKSTKQWGRVQYRSLPINTIPWYLTGFWIMDRYQTSIRTGIWGSLLVLFTGFWPISFRVVPFHSVPISLLCTVQQKTAAG